MRIAPRRFNPARVAWLPILHTDRGPRHYTALFSNTSRAHRLGKTDDWVIVHWADHDDEGQCTVITAPRGPMQGRRVVRGREGEPGYFSPEDPRIRALAASVPRQMAVSPSKLAHG